MIKKFEHIVLLLIITLFAGVILGLFIARYTAQTTVRISSQAAATQTESIQTAQAHSNGKININIASVKELTMLPGIGEGLAQRIVDYRQENGPFISVNDLSNVSGIGEKRIEAIAEYVTVGG